MTAGPNAPLEKLYREVNGAVRRLTDLHRRRLRCGPGCAACCVDDVTVFAVEAQYIARHHAGLLESGDPRAAGACAFLDAHDRCRIYEHRPYVCRTQGLPLRWFDEDADGNLIELRDICPRNGEGTPVEELPGEACWTIGPAEERLGALQHQIGGEAMTRVRLRTLFRKG
jgi:hypothetical protein